MTRPSALGDQTVPKGDGLTSCALVGERLRVLFQRWFLILVLSVGLLIISLFYQHPERLPPFLAIAVPVLLGLGIWTKRRGGTLPIFPVYLLSQSIVYAGPLFVPVLVPDANMREITVNHLNAAAMDLACWFSALLIGWRLLPGRLGMLRPFPALSKALDETGQWPVTISLVALAIGWFTSSDLLWQIAGASAAGLLNPLRTLQGILLLIGSFTGAYALAKGRLQNALIWQTTMVVQILLGLSSLLLSSIQVQALAILSGLWLAGARALLPVTMVLMLGLSFLHNGKVEIRARYWDSPFKPNPLSLVQEWVQISLDPPKNPGGPASDQGLFTARLNSFQNLAYVEDALQRGLPTLNGESFAVIPQVLLPRILNREKVRSQEGQALLNLHFGRQQTREQTEKAYIAWGLMTESIANYGQIIGPIVVGLIAGAMIRITENIGRGQFLLSTPGLASLFLLFAWATAYESAASTFSAMVFQYIIAIFGMGWFAARWMKRNAT